MKRRRQEKKEAPARTDVARIAAIPIPDPVLVVPRRSTSVPNVDNKNEHIVEPRAPPHPPPLAAKAVLIEIDDDEEEKESSPKALLEQSLQIATREVKERLAGLARMHDKSMLTDGDMGYMVEALQRSICVPEDGSRLALVYLWGELWAAETMKDAAKTRVLHRLIEKKTHLQGVILHAMMHFSCLVIDASGADVVRYLHFDSSNLHTGSCLQPFIRYFHSLGYATRRQEFTQVALPRQKGVECGYFCLAYLHELIGLWNVHRGDTDAMLVNIPSVFAKITSDFVMTTMRPKFEHMLADQKRALENEARDLRAKIWSDQ